MTESIRSAFATALALAVLLATVGLTLDMGSWPLAWDDAFFARGMDATVFWDFRLPRVAAVILVGACLGLSGAIFQTMLRNPLASPDVIGFTAGASAGAVATIALSGGTAYVVSGSLAGGLATAGLVMALSWRHGLDPFRLVLTGLALGIALTALTHFFLSVSGAPQAADAARWLAGSFNARGWESVVLLAGVLTLLTPVLCYLRFTLDRLDTGDDVARLLGLPVDGARLGLGLVAVVLAAAAVSVSGPLPFVAFMAGPIARGLARSAASCLVLAALSGATIAVLADLAARVGIQGYHLPAGVFIALIGGPYLLGLVIVQTKRNRL